MMKKNSIISIYRDQELLFEKVKIADTYWAKLRGFMFYSDLPGVDGLLLYPCNAVHMFWMQFPLDIIYLSKDKEVKYVCQFLAPNKIGPYVPEAFYVLEIKAGFISSKQIKSGNHFRW